jgi:lysozyme
MYTISSNGVLITEQFEGFIPHPYQKPGDIPTIGYGTTFYPGGRKVTMQDPSITRQQGLSYLLNYMNVLVSPILNNHVTFPLNQNQVDSLADFIYNEGSGGFIGSHLLVAINSNAGQGAISAEFRKWVYFNHQVDQVLVQRREGEIKLFFS